jgi:hypothetical protein
VIFGPPFSQWFGPVMVSFHHKYLYNLNGKVVLYICIGETDQNGAFMGEIHFDVANLFIIHRAIPILLHDTEDGPTKRRQLLVLTCLRPYTCEFHHVNVRQGNCLFMIKVHWSSYLTPSVWRMAALPKIVEEIVSGVLVVLKFFHFMWSLLMEVVSMY